MKPSATDIMALLRRIERREATLTSLDSVPPRDIYCGLCTYATSDGWEVFVFNDCDAWDYLDRVTDPAGDTATYDELWKDSGHDVLDDNAIEHPCCYTPTGGSTADIWGFG